MLGLGIFFLLILRAQAITMPYEVSLISWTYTNSSVYEFRLRLLGREHRLNGTVDIKEDIEQDSFTVGIETYNDAYGSGNFKKTPFVVRNQSLCKAIAGFWFYVKASIPFGEKTDLPFQNHTCPIPNGHYYIKDVTIVPENWPVIMPRGYFKYIVTFKKDQKVDSTLEIVVHVVDRKDYSLFTLQ